jgi:hypothetical protein
LNSAKPQQRGLKDDLLIPTASGSSSPDKEEQPYCDREEATNPSRTVPEMCPRQPEVRSPVRRLHGLPNALGRGHTNTLLRFQWLSQASLHKHLPPHAERPTQNAKAEIRTGKRIAAEFALERGRCRQSFARNVLQTYVMSSGQVDNGRSSGAEPCSCDGCSVTVPRDPVIGSLRSAFRVMPRVDPPSWLVRLGLPSRCRRVAV